MREQWKQWIDNYELPNGFRWSKPNGQLLFPSCNAHWLYFETNDGRYHSGIMLDIINNENYFKLKMKNAILKIQIDQQNPRTYKNYLINGKIHIVAP